MHKENYMPRLLSEKFYRYYLGFAFLLGYITANYNFNIMIIKYFANLL